MNKLDFIYENKGKSYSVRAIAKDGVIYDIGVYDGKNFLDKIPPLAMELARKYSF